MREAPNLQREWQHKYTFEYSIRYDSYDSYDSYDGTSTHVHTYHREEELHMFNEMHDGYYTFQRC